MSGSHLQSREANNTKITPLNIQYTTQFQHFVDKEPTEENITWDMEAFLRVGSKHPEETKYEEMESRTQ